MLRGIYLYPLSCYMFLIWKRYLVAFQQRSNQNVTCKYYCPSCIWSEDGNCPEWWQFDWIESTPHSFYHAAPEHPAHQQLLSGWFSQDLPGLPGPEQVPPGQGRLISPGCPSQSHLLQCSSLDEICLVYLHSYSMGRCRDACFVSPFHGFIVPLILFWTTWLLDCISLSLEDVCHYLLIYLAESTVYPVTSSDLPPIVIFSVARSDGCHFLTWFLFLFSSWC